MRTLDFRTEGTPHGFIRRMVSPGDLGERLKPFVFLDQVNGPLKPGTGFGFHPHSGIATLTYQRGADVAYEDTAGQKGTVASTGLEWMRAGGGTWHQGKLFPLDQGFTGFQLWLALPPGVEDGPAEGIYVPPAQVPQVGNVRVLLGTYGGVTNPIPAPSPVTYLDVELAADEAWRYEPAVDETIAWTFVYRGRARVCGEVVENELVILDASNGAFDIVADGPARVLVGVGKKHDHPLVLGSHSVHTNPTSLARGQSNIRAIGEGLRRDGRM